MPKVRFLQDRQVKDSTERVYRAGRVYELPEESCRHWINRGVAEPAGDHEEADPEPPSADEAREERERRPVSRAGQPAQPARQGPAPSTERQPPVVGESEGTLPARTGGFGRPVKGADKPTTVLGRDEDKGKDQGQEKGK